LITRVGERRSIPVDRQPRLDIQAGRIIRNLIRERQASKRIARIARDHGRSQNTREGPSIKRLSEESDGDAANRVWFRWSWEQCRPNCEEGRMCRLANIWAHDDRCDEPRQNSRTKLEHVLHLLRLMLPFAGPRWLVRCYVVRFLTLPLPKSHAP